MNTVGLVWACPTIGHTQFIAVRIGKMKVFCPKNCTLANNSRGDNEVSSLEFGGTVFSQKPNWTYINCESWCILHFRPFLAPFQTPILPPTCQVMIVDVQSYICCWMSSSAYIALSEGCKQQWMARLSMFIICSICLQFQWYWLRYNRVPFGCDSILGCHFYRIRTHAFWSATPVEKKTCWQPSSFVGWCWCGQGFSYAWWLQGSRRQGLFPGAALRVLCGAMRCYAKMMCPSACNTLQYPINYCISPLYSIK